MTNRELVMLAKDYDKVEGGYGGHYLSIKLDGQRAWWDGGVSRGMLKTEIPWANNDRDERYVTPPICTGLWTRYGNVIHAPDWFLESLPINVMLDGELYLGRGRFQDVRKVVSPLVPDARWRDVKFYVIDSPSPRMVFNTGKISNPQMTKFIHEESCLDIIRRKDTNPDFRVRDFKTTLSKLQDMSFAPHIITHEQVLLPMDEAKAKAIVEERLLVETSLGGEGLMLRKPYSIWHPKRSNDLLKIKKLQVDEGTVIGWISGDEGKLLGMMGALRVNWEGKEFALSGFTDVERCWLSDACKAWAIANPKTVCPDWMLGRFKIGDKVRFTYMTLTDEGKPREPRYCRK